MYMTELEVTNTVLRELGEQPLASLDDQYPTLDLVAPALESARLSLLEPGWWFNTFYDYSISPDQTGRIQVPEDTLGFIPQDRTLLWGGKYVRKPSGSLEFTSAVRGTRIADIALGELPYSAQAYVAYVAAAQVYSEDFGVDNKYQEIMSKAQAHYNALGQQHIRARRVNVRDRPVVRRLYRNLST